MIQFLTALVPLIGGFTQPLKDYFSFKKDKANKQYDLELARIKADQNAVISGNEARTQQIQSYLNAVTKKFRQRSYYVVMSFFLVSLVAPDYAKVMWTNFYLIPQEFRYLFITIHLVIWGIPVADQYVSRIFGSIGRGLQAKREYKIQKYNVKAAFDILRSGIFKKGLSKEQVKIVDKALDAYKGEDV